MKKYPEIICKKCMQMWNFESTYCPYCGAGAEYVVDMAKEDEKELKLDLLKESVKFGERGDQC